MARSALTSCHSRNVALLAQVHREQKWERTSNVLSLLRGTSRSAHPSSSQRKLDNEMRSLRQLTLLRLILCTISSRGWRKKEKLSTRIIYKPGLDVKQMLNSTTARSCNVICNKTIFQMCYSKFYDMCTWSTSVFSYCRRKSTVTQLSLPQYTVKPFFNGNKTGRNPVFSEQLPQPRRIINLTVGTWIKYHLPATEKFRSFEVPL